MTTDKTDDSPTNNRSGFRRLLLEWGGIAAVIAVLYFTGLHTEVLGTMQRAVLWTGLFDAEAETVDATDGPMLSEAAYGTRLTTAGGESLRLGELRGKVLFVNIWASWCAPCVAEMPTIQTLYDRVSGNENIRFLLISTDQRQEAAVRFMEDKDFSMPYYFPASGLPAQLRSSYIPATYVISRQGQIIYRREGIADYSSDSFRRWLLEQAQ